MWSWGEWRDGPATLLLAPTPRPLAETRIPVSAFPKDTVALEKSSMNGRFREPVGHTTHTWEGEKRRGWVCCYIALTASVATKMSVYILAQTGCANIYECAAANNTHVQGAAPSESGYLFPTAPSVSHRRAAAR